LQNSSRQRNERLAKLEIFVTQVRLRDAIFTHLPLHLAKQALGPAKTDFDFFRPGLAHNLGEPLTENRTFRTIRDRHQLSTPLLSHFTHQLHRRKITPRCIEVEQGHPIEMIRFILEPGNEWRYPHPATDPDFALCRL